MTHFIGMTNETALEAFEFLDRLREGGTINMFGASPVLADYLDLPRPTARQILSAWMETFDGTTTARTRAEKAFPS